MGDEHDKELLNFIAEAGMLKRVRRSGWSVLGIKDAETVAEHSFRCAVIGYILASMENIKRDLPVNYLIEDILIGKLVAKGVRVSLTKGVAIRVPSAMLKGAPRGTNEFCIKIVSLNPSIISTSFNPVSSATSLFIVSVSSSPISMCPFGKSQ